MIRKKKPIKLKSERVILSEVLPYELPLTFSNRHLYNFFITNKIRIINEKVIWVSQQKYIEPTLRILLGIGGKRDDSSIALKFNSQISFQNAVSLIVKEKFNKIFSIDFISNKLLINEEESFESLINKENKLSFFRKQYFENTPSKYLKKTIDSLKNQTKKNIIITLKQLEENKELKFHKTQYYKTTTNKPSKSFINFLNGKTKNDIILYLKQSIKPITNFEFVNTAHLWPFLKEVINLKNIQVDDYKARVIVLKKMDMIRKDFKSYKHDYSFINVNYKLFRNNPFNFRVTHKINDFRELSIIHPFNQLELIDFYNANKELILYYSKISKFSIRRPDSIAKTTYYNDAIHKKLKGDESENIEIQGKEYENLKHFFTYKDYSNIHKFFEDYRYHRCEKKYRNLFKFDILKYFDSIYTHTIVWALINKELVKDNLPASEKTFAGKFDKFMQNANYGETNGILIGPEFSRIFAELILQQIEKKVELQLRKENFYFKRDYEAYRYVDDTFLFFDDEKIKDRFMEIYAHELNVFKLSINKEKSISYTKPMITELSIAKLKLNELFNDNFNYKINEVEIESEEEKKKEKNYSLYVSSNKTITKFKSIIKESNIEYKDIINYSLAAINRKVAGLLNQYDSIISEIEEEIKSEEDRIEKYKLHEKRLISALIEILDFSFFIYSVVPRVNSTIKLSKTLIAIINKLKQSTNIDKHSFNERNIDLVFKKIQDDITLVLEQNKLKEHTQVETLYLLSILMELGRNYYIKKYPLASYFGMIEDNKTRKLSIPENISLNYLSISVLLFYIKNIKEYSEIRTLIKEHIIQRFKSTSQGKLVKNAEYVLMLFDLLNCPYLVDSGPNRNAFKYEILILFGVEHEFHAPMLKFINGQTNWFTKWSNFNFEKEINSKISQEVYS